MNYLKLKGDNNFLCLCCLVVVGYLVYLVLYNRPIIEGASCSSRNVEGMVNRKGQKLRKMMMEDARDDVKGILAEFPGCFNEKPKGRQQLYKKRGRRGRSGSSLFDFDDKSNKLRNLTKDDDDEKDREMEMLKKKNRSTKENGR